MEMYQIKAFIAVAEAGGFAAAARERDVAPSSITRAIVSLEATLGARLFQRTTRQVALTAAGEKLLQRIRPAIDEIDAALDGVTAGEKALSGVLRVSASVSYGQRVIVPALDSFHDRFPEISVELHLSDSIVDIIAERIDVAFRHGPLTDSGLIVRKLHDVDYWVVANPAYLDAHPKIRKPADIAGHQCVSFTYPGYRSQWTFERGGHCTDVFIRPKFTSTNAITVADLAKQGMGVALIADWTITDDVKAGTLRRILPKWNAYAAGAGTRGADTRGMVSIVTPNRTYTPAKTRAFVEHFQRRRA